MGRGGHKWGGGGVLSQLHVLGCRVNGGQRGGGGILLPTHLQELPPASREFLPRVGPVYTLKKIHQITIPPYRTK